MWMQDSPSARAPRTGVGVGPPPPIPSRNYARKSEDSSSSASSPVVASSTPPPSVSETELKVSEKAQVKSPRADSPAAALAAVMMQQQQEQSALALRKSPTAKAPVDAALTRKSGAKSPREGPLPSLVASGSVDSPLVRRSGAKSPREAPLPPLPQKTSSDVTSVIPEKPAHLGRKSAANNTLEATPVVLEKPDHLKRKSPRAAEPSPAEESQHAAAGVVYDLVCVECGYANGSSSATTGVCYSCSSPLQSSVPDVVIEVPASLRCASKSCGHLNYLDAPRCARCGRSFAETDSFIQEDIFNGLKEALGVMSDEDEEFVAVLQSGTDEVNDEMLMSIMAPEEPAPMPPPPRTRKQTLMSKFSEQLRSSEARQSSDDSCSDGASVVLVSEEEISEFVQCALSNSNEDWEPQPVADNVERFRSTSTTAAVDEIKLKSVAVLTRLGANEAEDLLWTFANLPRFDSQIYECKLLRQVSSKAVVLQLTVEVAGVGRMDLQCGRVRGQLENGNRYIVMKSLSEEFTRTSALVSDLVEVKMHGFVLTEMPEKAGICCVHLTWIKYDSSVSPQVAAPKWNWNVLPKVMSIRQSGARPAPPAHSPANVAIRKLTIAKIPVKLTSDRDKVANEVLTSEQTYFQSLLILGSFYIGPILHSALSSGNTLVYDTFQGIGFAADALVPFNQALLSELEKRMRMWNESETLGDVFDSVDRMQGVYTKYIQAYSDMISKVALCEKNAAFTAQMRELKRGGMVNQLDLRSYLIMPVQRFPRYELLLRDLLRVTDPQHKDASLLKEALAKVESVNQAINKAMQEATNKQKLSELTAMFVSDPGIRGDGQRRLLKEGVLVKQCSNSRANRKFFLFSDLLLYAKIIPGTGTKFSAERYLLSEKLSLQYVHFEDRADDFTVEPKVVHSFVLRFGDQKAFAVFAASEDDKSEWMLSLSNALSSVLPSQDTEAMAAAGGRGSATAVGRSSAAAVASSDAPEAPEWQDDTDVLQCGLCVARFSLLVRKYHCRLCGSVVCGSCSEGRVVVAAWGEDQLRCCKKCFVEFDKHPGVVKVMPSSPRMLASAGKSLTGSLSKMTMSRSSKRGQ